MKVNWCVGGRWPEAVHGVKCGMEDIRALLRAQRGRLNMGEVQEYFALFERQDMLDELLAEIANDPA